MSTAKDEGIRMKDEDTRNRGYNPRPADQVRPPQPPPKPPLSQPCRVAAMTCQACGYAARNQSEFDAHSCNYHMMLNAQRERDKLKTEREALKAEVERLKTEIEKKRAEFLSACSNQRNEFGAETLRLRQQRDALKAQNDALIKALRMYDPEKGCFHGGPPFDPKNMEYCPACSARKILSEVDQRHADQVRPPQPPPKPPEVSIEEKTVAWYCGNCGFISTDKNEYDAHSCDYHLRLKTERELDALKVRLALSSNLRDENRELKVEIERLDGVIGKEIEERKKIEAERDALKTALDTVSQQRDSLQRERDELLDNMDKLKKQLHDEKNRTAAYQMSYAMTRRAQGALCEAAGYAQAYLRSTRPGFAGPKVGYAAEADRRLEEAMDRLRRMNVDLPDPEGLLDPDVASAAWKAFQEAAAKAGVR